jgi:chlorite dismutase
MKAGIIFTGTGPILILTTYSAFDDPTFVQKLEAKGIRKFIAYELDVDLVRKKYGKQYDVVLGDVKQQDDLRVLDYNGHNVFYNFTFGDLGQPVTHE